MTEDEEDNSETYDEESSNDEESYDEEGSSDDEESYDEEESADEEESYEEESSNDEEDSYEEDSSADEEDTYEEDPDEGSGSSSGGSGAGGSITSIADSYVGGKYVYGGSSLSSGVDCSHFVWLVLQQAGAYSGGYMTSGEWAYAGSPVSSLSEAQAGDVIVYSGHVAIYDGNGGIIEAQSSKAGITHSRSAAHGSIVAIRRF